MKQSDSTLIYLATPYWHVDEDIREHRFHAVNRFAAKLMEAGLAVYSPITQGHTVRNYLKKENQHSHDFWLNLDKQALLKCDLMIAYLQEGWQASKGVREELDFAFEHKLGVMLVEPEAPFSEVLKHLEVAKELSLSMFLNSLQGDTDDNTTKH